MSQMWYYKRDGQECGPVTAADLKLLADAKRLLPMDMVRKDGSAKWRQARSVRGLFDDPAPGFWARAAAVWGTSGLIASGAAVLFVLVGVVVLVVALHGSAAANTAPPAAVATTPVPTAPAPTPPTGDVGKADVARPRRLLDALREMHEACAELKGGEHDRDGAIEDASHALDKAIDQTERALRTAGLTCDTAPADPNTYKKYSDHPHLRQALNDILEAKIEIRDAHFNFGDERENTVRQLGVAADKIESALKYDHK